MTDLVLKRLAYRSDGIFSALLLDGAPRFVTLEHAFPLGIGDSLLPVIPPGEFECKRGVHQLAHSGPFQTYEVTGVAGHSGLLFHWGNVNADSDGCVLLGLQFGFVGGVLQVLNSRLAFQQFMDWANNRESLSLTVQT